MTQQPGSAPRNDEEPLSLDFDDAGTAAGQKSQHIKAFGAAAMAGRTEQKLARAMNLPGTGATRCRMFHSKVTIAALEHMTNTINEWLDGSDIEIKHVSEVIGVVEGKKAEPNLIVIVWY